MPKTILEVASFGAISAEDDDLKKYFVQTDIYKDIQAGKRQVIIGRKGSGKTALYRALLEQQPTRRTVGLTFQNYPWALHYRYESRLEDRHSRFVQSWRFLVFLEILKVILNDQDRAEKYQGKDQKDALKAVEDFIKKNWGVLNFDYKKTFPAGGFQLNSFEFKPEVMGNAVGGVGVSRDGGALGDTLSRLNEWLWSCLSTVAPGAPQVFILFDELDAGFDPTLPDYLDRVIGLLLAIRGLSRDFTKVGARFFPVVFLRSDIFSALHFGDKNKLTETNAKFLVWNEDLEYSGSSLKELIDHRIRRELDLDASVKQPWTHAFDAQSMRGTQHKFNHITFRTYRRPRDVIKFCNCALDAAKKRIRSLGAPHLITNDDIRAARRPYSEYLLAELDDEIASSQPDWAKYVEVLKKIGTVWFKKRDFASAFRALKKPLNLQLSEESALQFLYDYSIIGFERAAGGTGLAVHFQYFDESVRFDAEARQFLVHRGLKEVLEIKEPTGGGGEEDGA